MPRQKLPLMLERIPAVQKVWDRKLIALRLRMQVNPYCAKCLMEGGRVPLVPAEVKDEKWGNISKSPKLGKRHG